MKLRLYALAALVSVIANNAASAAQPDNQAYRRGVELYDSWQYQSALQSFIEADSICPNNGYIYCYVGEIMYFANKYQVSFDYARQSLSYFGPDDSTGKANAYLHLAFLAEFNNISPADRVTDDDAAYYFDAAVKSAPDYAKARIERANYYNIYKEDFVRSDSDYIKAIELDPTEVEPYSRLIWSYRDRGMTDKVIEYCRMCIANVTDYPHHYDILATTLLDQGKSLEARDLLWEAFMKSNGPYYQGMDAVAKFPDEDRQWFINRIQEQATKNPGQTHWKEYLE